MVVGWFTFGEREFGMAKKSRLIWIIIVLTVVLFLAWLMYYELDRRVWITFCDVGQGDGVLIRQGSVQLVVDGGQANGRMVDCIAGQLAPWDRKLELVVATHPDADHIGGLVELLENYRVEKVIDNGQEAASDVAQRFRQLAQGKCFSAHAGDLIRLGEISLEVLGPQPSQAQVLGEEDPTADRNNESVVLMFDYDRFEFLLTGDAGLEVEEDWRIQPVEILKVSHHGSKTGTSAALLELIQPELAVISVGKNWYGHPAEVILDRLKAVGSQIKRTDQDGAVKIVTDGQTWRVVGR